MQVFVFACMLVCGRHCLNSSNKCVGILAILRFVGMHFGGNFKRFEGLPYHLALRMLEAADIAW